MLDYDNCGMFGFFAWALPKKQDASAPTIYLQTLTDRTGGPLTGDKTYRLHVPPIVPARQYFLITVYDLDTGGVIREAPVIRFLMFVVDVPVFDSLRALER